MMTDRNGNAAEIDPTRLEPQIVVPPEPTPSVSGNGSSTALGEDRPRPGRPTKYEPSVVRTICEAVADGMPFRLAADLGGISPDTFYTWKKEYPEFSDTIQEARAKGVQARLKIITAAAEKGDVKAAQWWLEHTLPEHFARNRIEHAGQVSVQAKPSSVTTEYLREAWKRCIRAEVTAEVREEMRKSNALTSGSGAVVRAPVEATSQEAAAA